MSVISVMRRTAVVVAACLVLAACQAAPQATPAVTPGATPEGPTPQAPTPEAPTPEAPTPEAPTPEPPAERVTFRIASDNQPTEPVIRCGVDILQEELSDLFDVQIFHSAQLGQAAQVLQLVAANQFEASMVGAGQLQAFWAPMGIFSAIYVIDDHEHAQRVWDGPIGDDLRAGLAEASNLHVANFYWYGTRQLTSNKPIRSPADMAGVRLRVAPGSQIAFTNGTAMGGNPTTLPFGELYLGLSQGVVEAQENPLPTINSASFFEVQDYLNLTNHEPSPQFLVSNVDFFNSLSPQHREAFEAAAEVMAANVLDCVLEMETELLEEWRAEGTWRGGIIDDVDVDAFRAQAEPVLLDAYSETWAPLDLYNRIRAESNR